MNSSLFFCRDQLLRTCNVLLLSREQAAGSLILYGRRNLLYGNKLAKSVANQSLQHAMMGSSLMGRALSAVQSRVR